MQHASNPHEMRHSYSPFVGFRMACIQKSFTQHVGLWGNQVTESNIP